MNVAPPYATTSFDAVADQLSSSSVGFCHLHLLIHFFLPLYFSPSHLHLHQTSHHSRSHCNTSSTKNAAGPPCLEGEERNLHYSAWSQTKRSPPSRLKSNTFDKVLFHVHTKPLQRVYLLQLYHQHRSA